MIEFVNLARRAKLRSIIRSYRSLVRSGRIDLIRLIKSELLVLPHVISHNRLADRLFFLNNRTADTSIQQYLATRLINSKLIQNLIYSSSGRVKVAIIGPSSWVQHINESGIRVSQLGSSVLWFKWLIIEFFRNSGKCLVLLLNLKVLKKSHLLDSYVYFYNINETNVPQKSSATYTCDLCTWYIRHRNKFSVKIVAHSVLNAFEQNVCDVKVISVPAPYAYCDKYSIYANIILRFIVLFIASIWCLLAGKWYYSIFIYEALKSYIVSKSDRNRLAVEYLFQWAGEPFRPLWTYELEKFNVNVTCYFFSNSMVPHLRNRPNIKHELLIETWPNYLVWTHEQKSQLNLLVSKSKAEIVGPIWFSDSVSKQLNMNNTVAVFNVEPFRDAYQFGISTYAEWLIEHPNLNELFLNDISDVLLSLGKKMAWKRKRDIKQLQSKKSIQLNNKILSMPHVISVDHTISPRRITNLCYATISFPFTSTAFFGDNIHEGNHIYYDPTGWIVEGDSSACGIPLIVGKNNLKIWLQSLG